VIHARVAAVDRDQLLLLSGADAFRARLSGTFLHEHAAPERRPCVGDWVLVDKGEHHTVGTIHALLERRTWLRRKAPGDPVAYQMIAANVDVVFVVQSCHTDFNVRRIERYLTMVREGGATPIILLTKSDLVTPHALAGQLEDIARAGISNEVITLSHVSGDGLAVLRAMLVPGQTYCFVGSSGVGKSTLINALLGHVTQRTQDVSGTGEGRHTTVRRALVTLPNGAMVIDNPGMREFGVMGAADGIAAAYANILELASTCRFSDCTHGGEPGCAIADALQRGELDAGHVASFLQLRKESSFNDLSYAERREKQRAFGRMKHRKQNE